MIPSSRYRFPGFWRCDTKPADGLRLFREVPRKTSAEQVCASRLLGQMLEEAHYRGLLESLEQDETIGRRLDHVVAGAGLGGTTWQAHSMILFLVDEVLEWGKSNHSSSGTPVEFHAQQWLASLRRDVAMVTWVGLLGDLESSAGLLKVADRWEIDELTDLEISYALHFRLPITTFPQGEGFGSFGRSAAVPRQSSYGARRYFATPLIVGDQSPSDVATVQAERSAAAEEFEEMILALRLYRRGGVRGLGFMEYADPDSYGGGSLQLGAAATAPRLPAPHTVLSESDDEEFRGFWRDFGSARGNKLIDVTARRFGYAGDRQRFDDEIVDLVIAAESFFLGELGKPTFRGELIYRLATRAASFLQLDGVSKRQLVAFMRNAYAARSSIVHGGDLDSKTLKDFDGAPLEVGDFADRVEEVLRQALKQAIAASAAGGVFPPDWDALLFP